MKDNENKDYNLFEQDNNTLYNNQAKLSDTDFEKLVNNVEKREESFESVGSRSSKNNRKKENKEKKDRKKTVEKSPEIEEALKEDAKKRKKKKFWMSFYLILIVAISAFGGIYVLNNKVGNAEVAKDILYTRFKEVFEDEEKTEIKREVPREKYDEIQELLPKVEEGTSKLQFKKWNEVLKEQYANQNKAVSGLDSLYEKGKKYISQKATEDKFTEVDKELNTSYNKELQKELLKSFEELKQQFYLMTEAKKAITSLEKSELGSLDESKFEIVKLAVDKNPNDVLKASQNIKIDGKRTEWNKYLEKVASENKVKEEQAQKEYLERLEKEKEEAKKNAEYQAQVEAERQKAYAEEKARLEAEAEAKRLEELKRQEEEAKKNELQNQNNQNNQGNLTTPSTTPDESKPVEETEVPQELED